MYVCSVSSEGLSRCSFELVQSLHETAQVEFGHVLCVRFIRGGARGRGRVAWCGQRVLYFGARLGDLEEMGRHIEEYLGGG